MNSILLALLVSGVQLRTTLFVFPVFVNEDSREFSIFENANKAQKSLELVLDINMGRIVSFESFDELEKGTFESAVSFCNVFLPEIKEMFKKFLQNYLSERIN